MLPCQGCAYQRSIPGNCHIRCAFDWLGADAETQAKLPVNQGSARTARWFMFPFNFDPVWGPDECPARSETLDAEKLAKPNPLFELLSMLG